VKLGSSTQHRLIFLPGFVSPASAYRDLLAPLAAANLAVEVPQLYRVGPRVLSGRYTILDEATAAAELVPSSPGHTIWFGGHSRGGHAAFVASQLVRAQGVKVAGLMLIDPVRSGPLVPKVAEPIDFPRIETLDMNQVPLIIGAGRGGKCAPAARNHQQFADETHTPLHLVVSDMGHADILNGRPLALGRRLCGGGEDPDMARGIVTQIMTSYVERELVADGALPTGAIWESGNPPTRN